MIAVVVVVLVGSFVLLSPPAPPAPASSLPVPAGSVFTASVAEEWAAHFTVGPGGGTLQGSWTAYDGSGTIELVLENATVSKPPPPTGPVNCPGIYPWVEQLGTINTFLPAGPFTVYWGTVCANASRIVLTQTLEVLPA